MCTALSLLTFKKEHLFGRNMDLEYTFGQRPVVVPRNYEYVEQMFLVKIKSKICYYWYGISYGQSPTIC